MAVFKSTYCYPFQTSLDPRVINDSSQVIENKIFKCKVESSNKNISGYSIKLYDGNNQQIFPYNNQTFISPISELPSISGSTLNSGINGSYLEIPLIQYNHKKTVASKNAVYYDVYYHAKYFIGTSGHGLSGNDNIANWEFNSATSTLHKEQWDGSLNNDLVIIGDTVAVLSNDNSSGIYIVQENGDLYRVTVGSLLKSVASLAEPPKIVITQGCYHNNIFAWNTTQSAFIFQENYNPWVDIHGNAIKLDVEGGTYKWVITLYQGDEFTTLQDVISSSLSVPYLDYSSQSIDWYDMTLTSGQILGSTANRLQLSDNEETSIPGDSGSSPLVLQTRYAQLVTEYTSGSQTTNRNTVSYRAYVESFDATHGHVYPKSGSFAYADVQAATHCMFYKYSNDPQAIDASDQVVCASTANIDLSTGGLISVDSIMLEENDLVLVKDQTEGKENGIYVAHENSAWTRSGSYSTWSNFIGKIIFVQSGSINGGKNFMSQASAGGSLYNPDTPSGQTGNSVLYFSAERPIVLFPQKLTLTVSHYTQHMSDLPSSTLSYVDGYQVVNSGVLVATEEGIYISTVVNTTVTWTLYAVLIDNGLYYIEKGKVNGLKTILWSETDDCFYESMALYKAKILKNTTGKTYISPYINLSPDMVIRFNSENKVTIASTNVSQSYLKIATLNNVVWSITHSVLTSPLESYSDVNIAVPYHYDVKSFFKASDENPFSCYETPYLRINTNGHGYSDITTYQRYVVDAEHYSSISAFPPAAQAVVDTIYIDDSDSKSYHIVNGQYALTVPQVDNNGYYMVWTTNAQQTRGAFTFPSPSITMIAQRYITVQGLYQQPQMASWESYRWVLTDSAGTILQDTGKCYDKDMSTTFYGLTKQEDTIYYATLYVEDSLNNSLDLTLRFLVSSDKMSSTGVPFYAWYDCDSQSVLLKLENMSYAKPSVILDNDVYEQAYTSNNYNLTNEVYDGSINYSDSSLKITFAGSQATLYNASPYTSDNGISIYTCGGSGAVSSGSGSGGSGSSSGNGYVTTWDGYLPILNLYSLDNNLSYSIENGVRYQSYWGMSEIQQLKGSQSLTLLDDAATGYSNGAGYVDTLVVLDDNFCGNIVTMDFETSSHGNIEFSLSIPSNFESNYGSTRDTLNTNRNKIEWSFRYINGGINNELGSGFVLYDNVTDYMWMDLSATSESLYYLQKEVIAAAKSNLNNTYEFVHYATIYSGKLLVKIYSSDDYNYFLDKYDTLYYYDSVQHEYVESQSYDSSISSYYYDCDLQPWYANEYPNVAITSDKPLNTLINIHEDIVGSLSYNMSSNYFYNISELSTNSATYWRDNGPTYHYMSSPKFHNQYMNVIEEDFSIVGLVDSVMYWPSEDRETDMFLNETRNTTYTSSYSTVDNIVPLTWNGFTHSVSSKKVGQSDLLYPIRLLTAYDRHPAAWSSKSMRVIFKIYDIDAFMNVSQGNPLSLQYVSTLKMNFIASNVTIASLQLIIGNVDSLGSEQESLY